MCPARQLLREALARHCVLSTFSRHRLELDDFLILAVDICLVPHVIFVTHGAIKARVLLPNFLL